MSKNIGLVVDVNLQTKGMLGIKNKTIGQAKGFSSNEAVVSLFCCDGPALVRLIFRHGSLVESQVLLVSIASGTFFFELSQLLSEKGFEHDYWYFRYIPMMNDGMVLCAEKCSAGASKVFFEVPTYPYDRELAREWAETDRLLQDKLLPYVSGVFSPSFADDNNIFLGKEIIRMHNGVDFDLIPQVTACKDTESFCLIGVGWISHWHGYDRIIKSIPEFVSRNPNVEFRFYIVGEGPVKNELQTLVDSFELNPYVIFTGARTGKALDEIYAQCSLGIASLGLHRLDPDGAFEVLKVREYLARGFPTLLSHKDSADYYHLPGVFRVNGDESTVDLSHYYQKTQAFWQTQGAVAHNQYATENFSYKKITNEILSVMENIAGDLL